MRAWLFVACVLGACGGSNGGIEPAAAGEGDERAACAALGSDDVEERSDAARALVPRTGFQVGGTEQELEAAVRYCIRTYAMRPPWWSEPTTSVDVDAC